MALTLGANLTDEISHGTAVSAFVDFSVLMCVFPTSTIYKSFLNREGPPDEDLCPLVDGDTEIRVVFSRATDNLVYITNNFSLAVNDWVFIGATLNTSAGAGSLVEVYRGSLTEQMTARTFGSVNDGSGTFRSNASELLHVGNQFSLDAPFVGRIAFCMLWPGIVLTQAQLRAQQFKTFPIFNGCELLSHYGYNDTGTQPDWSGHDNNGTVTGATLSGHVPLGPLYGYDQEWLGAFTAAVAARRFLLVR